MLEQKPKRTLGISRLVSGATLPKYDVDTGVYHIYAPEAFYLDHVALVPLGIYISEIPSNCKLIFFPPEDLSSKYGVKCSIRSFTMDDDVFTTTKKHQMYLRMEIPDEHQYEFWYNDVIAHAMIIGSEEFDIVDVTDYEDKDNLDVVVSEIAKDYRDRLHNKNTDNKIPE